MTNKEYKAAREAAEHVEELYEFEKEIPGTWHTSKMLDTQELKELRAQYKQDHGILLNGFNNRAIVIKVKGGFVLKSYNTNVAYYDIGNDEMIRTWDGFSVTTLKHINIFRSWLGLGTISKREWIELDTHRIYTVMN